MDSISSFRSTRDFENLKTERGRLDTFSLPPVWPVTFITPEDCAKAGFFYLQDGDKVSMKFFFYNLYIPSGKYVNNVIIIGTMRILSWCRWRVGGRRQSICRTSQAFS